MNTETPTALQRQARIALADCKAQAQICSDLRKDLNTYPYLDSVLEKANERLNLLKARHSEAGLKAWRASETLTLAKRELEHMGYSDIIISHDELHVQVWNKDKTEAMHFPLHPKHIEWLAEETQTRDDEENAPIEYGDDERGCDMYHQLKDDSLWTAPYHFIQALAHGGWPKNSKTENTLTISLPISNERKATT